MSMFSDNPHDVDSGSALENAKAWAQRLANAPEAAFVVDPVLARIEEANIEARRLLGLLGASIRFPVALDTAMPAMRRLRALSQAAGIADACSPADGSKTETYVADEVLTLWCGEQLISLPAKLTRTNMNDGRPVMLVHATRAPIAAREARELSNSNNSDAQNGRDAAKTAKGAAGQPQSGPTQSSTLQTSTGSGDQPPPLPPIPRDDRETLREIARRIREGGKVRKAAETAPISNTAPIIPAPLPTAELSPAAVETATRPPRPPFQNAATDPRQLSKIAHELKSPLSAIVAAAEIMRDERLGSMGNTQYLGYAADIHASARHALDVINAMLTGTHAEIRTIDVIDLAELADLTVSAMLPLAHKTGITLDAESPDGRLEVIADATAVRQIIFNLISNALKFTPVGGDVRVVTGYLDNGLPYLVVRDTGGGMTEDEIAAAFFERESDGRQRLGGGYGLGLPMVRRLAEAMQVTIDIDSAPDKGTVILMTFPAPRT